MRQLDITPLKEKGDELKKMIIEGVKDTQRIIIQELPSELLMTKEQFNDLQSDPMMQNMFQSNEYLYQTPLNVMEVVVKGVDKIDRKLIELA